MIAPGDIQNFLPQYLSPKTTDKLLADLADFPANIDKRIYGFDGREDYVIYQGDGIDNLPIFNLPDTQSKSGNGIVLSNTCDIDLSNERKYFSANIVYAPVLNVRKYESGLLAKNIYNKDTLRNHLQDIRRQYITSIFYLPAYGDFEESFVPFDRIMSIRNDLYNRNGLRKYRLFSLSQYGHYLFLYKLSIHFTRFHEKVDRQYS
jgi:hypothetical protein